MNDKIFVAILLTCGLAMVAVLLAPSSRKWNDGTMRARNDKIFVAILLTCGLAMVAVLLAPSSRKWNDGTMRASALADAQAHSGQPVVVATAADGTVLFRVWDKQEDMMVYFSRAGASWTTQEGISLPGEGLTNAISAGPFLQVGVSGTGLAPGRGRDLGSVEAPPFLFAKQEKSLPQERREGRMSTPRSVEHHTLAASGPHTQ